MPWGWLGLAEAYRGLIVDFGGVLTTSLRDAFRSFTEREGIDYERVREAMRTAYGSPDAQSMVARFETGRVEREHFERELATALSRGLEKPLEPENLVLRMLQDLRLDDEMVEAVRAARRGGVATALLSNSWGVEYYPHDLLDELFDQVVISGEVGLRKPDPPIFEMAAERLGLPPGQCVFIDDLPGNIEAAEAVGMRGVLHQEASKTIPELEQLLGVSLRRAVDTLYGMDEYITAREAFERRDELQLLDVREAFEWEAGRIEGAVHIPLNDLMAGTTDGLDPNKPVVAYCKTANRSEVARLMLRAKGFDAATMEGGGEAWVQEGLPFPTPSGDPGVCA